MAIRILIVGWEHEVLLNVLSKTVLDHIIVICPIMNNSILDKVNISMIKEKYVKLLDARELVNKTDDRIVPYWQRLPEDTVYEAQNGCVKTKGERYLINKRGAYFK